MKVRSLKDIERDIRKETEKANTAAQYDMYASSVDDMFRAACQRITSRKEVKNEHLCKL